MRNNNRNVARFSSVALAFLAMAAVHMPEARADGGGPTAPRIIEQVVDGGAPTAPRIIEQIEQVVDGGGPTAPRAMAV